MAIVISDSPRDRLRNFEDQFTERKAEGAANKAELRKALIGFANTVPEGRTAILYIGIADDGAVTGVASPDSLQRTVAGVCAECYPAIRSFTSEVLDIDGKAVLAVIVGYSADRPHFPGPAYVRRGSQTVVASADEYEALIASRNSKTREILKWKHKAITVVVRDGAQRAKYDAMVVDCTAFYVYVSLPAHGDRYVSWPLENAAISRDTTQLDRLQLNIRLS